MAAKPINRHAHLPEPGSSMHAPLKPKLVSSVNPPQETNWGGNGRVSLHSIRWKILVIAIIAAISFASYLGFNLVQANSQAELLEDIRDKRYPLQLTLQEAVFSLRFIQAKMQDAVITGELDSLLEVEDLKRDFYGSIESAIKIDPTKSITLINIKSNFDRYFNASYELAEDLINNEADMSAAANRGERNATLYEQLDDSLDEFKVEELRNFTNLVNLVTERANSVIRIGWPVGLITVFLMITLALLISHWIIKRINYIVSTIQNIANEEGDMSVRIPVTGRDEMAALSYWFNQFIEKLERVTLESTREIKRLAFTDALTNLPNRRLFTAYLKSEISRCIRREKKLAIMFLDLDNFKQINDQQGHDAGDAVVCEVARRLEKTLRGYDLISRSYESGIPEGNDLAARMGGDEFMLVIADLGESRQAAMVAERIRKAILAPIELPEQSVEIGVSIGIAIYPDDSSNAEELTVKADLAMYEAKNRGKNNFCFFSADLEEAAKLEADTEIALREAIRNDDLELYYQPKYELSTGKVIGVEALLRWQHPELGQMAPDVFVPIAEATNLIYELDAWVLERACSQIKEWRQVGVPTVPVAVNISAQQASKANLADIVSAQIDKAGLPSYSLEVEITETSALKDMETVANNVTRLQQLDVTVALDDFGAGHSSLSLLKYCRIDTLKIDRLFISELGQTDKQNTIIAGVIALAKVLKLSVVAEGVEEKEQSELLKQMGCDYGQGYLFARPMKASEFEIFMHEKMQ